MNYVFIGLVVLAVIFRLGFDVFIAKTGGKINYYLGSGILSIAATLAPLAVYMFIKHKNVIPTTKGGIVYAIVAGISVAAYTIVLFKLFEKGENLSIVSPAIYGGVIVGTALIGWFAFREQVSLFGALGVLLIAIGVAFIIYARNTV